MEHKQINSVLKRMKRAFSHEELSQLGNESGLCRRQRKITPYRLALSLLQSLGEGRVETIADIQREFNRLHGENVQYKPFHNQLAKASFPEFMRSLCESLMSKLSDDVLGFSQGSPFSRFSHISLHDGSSFALKSALKNDYPGRFTAISPAAVELHVTLELLSEMPQSISLAPDSESEVHFAPEASSLQDGLLLADRMFFIKDYLAQIQTHGGHYVVKTKGTLNPIVDHAWRKDGSEIKSWRGCPLKTLKSALAKHKYVDIDVHWEGRSLLETRVIATWNEKEKRPRYLATNLPREAFSGEQVCDAYRLRWQIELMFKEWKSYANLHVFDTKKPEIAEGLIWASICAALLKRFLAHAAQRVHRVAISTRIAAMCLTGMLSRLFGALIHNRRQFHTQMNIALQFLAENAQRSHPKREQLVGRSKLGLSAIYSAA